VVSGSVLLSPTSSERSKSGGRGQCGIVRINVGQSKQSKGKVSYGNGNITQVQKDRSWDSAATHERVAVIRGLKIPAQQSRARLTKAKLNRPRLSLHKWRLLRWRNPKVIS
jgi:hypothetical protein